MRVGVLVLWVAASAAACAEPIGGGVEVTQADEPLAFPPDTLTLPNAAGSLKLAIIGDSGRGTAEQHEVAARMAAFQERFAFRHVLMAGDNIYEGPATPDDYRRKFEEPYAALLARGVRFFAVLGNHDDPRQVHYAPFHMGGHRYYTFAPEESVRGPDVRVFAIDSTQLDGEQMRWLQRELPRSAADWTFVLMHYPMYAAGRYGLRARQQRFMLESLFVAAGVDAVFSGHEHFYQRSTPQRGVVHFVSGAAGSLRPDDARDEAWVARSYDDDYHFMLAEVSRGGLFFQAIDRQGRTVDAGAMRRLAPAPVDAGAMRRLAPASGTDATTDTAAHR